jgi:hypothetical protein
MTITAWDSNSRTVRLTLPPAIDPDVLIGVGAIGAGWLELTDDPEAPRLEIDTERQTRNRVALHATGGLRRFAAEEGVPVLVTVTGPVGHQLIRVVTLDELDHALLETHRPRMLQADGWEVWRERIGQPADEKR